MEVLVMIMVIIFVVVQWAAIEGEMRAATAKRLTIITWLIQGIAFIAGLIVGERQLFVVGTLAVSMIVNVLLMEVGIFCFEKSATLSVILNVAAVLSSALYCALRIKSSIIIDEDLYGLVIILYFIFRITFDAYKIYGIIKKENRR